MKLDRIWNTLALLRPETVLYIGGSDVLPAPLKPEQERALLARLAAGDALNKCQEYGNMTGAVNTTAAGGTTAFTCREDVERIGRERFGFTM